MNDDAIAAPLAAALSARGYETLTPVQQAMLAPDVAGRDALVSAQTGSGKTVAFGMAIAPDLLRGADRLLFADVPMALIIAPTRELALAGRARAGLALRRDGRADRDLCGRHGLPHREARAGSRRAYRGGHAGPPARPYRPRLARPVGAARGGAGRGGRDARPRVPRGSGVHPGRRPARTPHDDVLGHRAARHRGAGQGFPARRAAHPDAGRGAPACRHRIQGAERQLPATANMRSSTCCAITRRGRPSCSARRG